MHFAGDGGLGASPDWLGLEIIPYFEGAFATLVGNPFIVEPHLFLGHSLCGYVYGLDGVYFKRLYKVLTNSVNLF